MRKRAATCKRCTEGFIPYNSSKDFYRWRCWLNMGYLNKRIEAYFT